MMTDYGSAKSSSVSSSSGAPECYWCELQGEDDDVVCVCSPDADRAAIERSGPCDACEECIGEQAICWDGEVPPEWEPFIRSCDEEAAIFVPIIENYLTNNFDCDFQVVEKRRQSRGGLDSWPESVINIAWLGCCDQEEPPP
jgi:hypothetical protein